MRVHINFKRYIRNNPKQVKQFELYNNKNKYWRLNGKYHREDGPAVLFEKSYIEKFDHKEWWLNGHRLTESGYLSVMKK